MACLRLVKCRLPEVGIRLAALAPDAAGHMFGNEKEMC